MISHNHILLKFDKLFNLFDISYIVFAAGKSIQHLGKMNIKAEAVTPVADPLAAAAVISDTVKVITQRLHNAPLYRVKALRRKIHICHTDTAAADSRPV